MTDYEIDLLSLLSQRSFRIGQFRLASGEISDYYIDVRKTSIYSYGSYLIGEVFYELTKSLSFDAIGGLQVGSVPLTTATVMSCYRHNRTMEGFWVRDGVKDHGTRSRIEGGLQNGNKVVILDDVFTTGGSTLKAVEAVREIGCEVVMVLGLVDRLRGARELFRLNGIDNYRTVFTVRDFGVKLPSDVC